MNQIFSTTDYSKFKFINGNRVVNPLNVHRIMSRFYPNHPPIIVMRKIELIDGKYETVYYIIDGQHRFIAAKTLGLPIRFYIDDNASLEVVQLINAHSSSWKKIDYLKSFCDNGKPEYLMFRAFMEKYPSFKFSVCEVLLLQTKKGKQGTIDGQKVQIKYFEEGNLSIPDYETSVRYADMIMMFEPYFEFYNDVIFVRAIIDFFKNKNYNHLEMIGKVAMLRAELYPCKRVEQYKDMFEKAYNYRRKIKVSLKY